MFSTDGGERDPVRLFKLWPSKRPDGMKDNGPLYLTVINRPKSADVWYARVCMGENIIGNIVKSMATCLKTTKKLTNHSIQKTLVSKFKKSGQARNVICEITVHSRESSLDYYDEVDENQRKDLSHIISVYQNTSKENPKGQQLVQRQRVSSTNRQFPSTVQLLLQSLLIFHNKAISLQISIHVSRRARMDFPFSKQVMHLLHHFKWQRRATLFPFHRHTIQAALISRSRRALHNHKRNDELFSLNPTTRIEQMKCL